MDESKELLNVNDTLPSESESPSTYEKNEEICENPSETQTPETDYAQIVLNDIRMLSEEFAELAGLTDICQLENPLRYAALRDLGLTPAEAYLATTRTKHSYDNRSHLYSSPMVSSAKSSHVPERDMRVARELFSDMSDSQIRQLYNKVTR